MKWMPQIQFAMAINHWHHKLISLFILLCFSCNSDDDSNTVNTITGEWLLIEVLADPGDGSGQFRRVDSDKRISFMEDRTFSSNGDVCSFSILSDGPTDGTYQEDDNGLFIDCDSPFPSPVRLQLLDGNLILTFTCIEPCQQKFRKQN